MTEYEPDDPQPVRVDIDGLFGFARELRGELDAGLRPWVLELINTYNYGVQVGAGLPSPSMAMIQRQYQLCLARIIEQLENFVLTSAVLADAAELIAQRYSDADGLAAAPLADIQAALAAAQYANPNPLTMPTRPDKPILVIGQEAA